MLYVQTNESGRSTKESIDKKLGETGEKSIYGTLEEMQERVKEGYFVRNPERNLDCPAREILRQT